MIGRLPIAERKVGSERKQLTATFFIAAFLFIFTSFFSCFLRLWRQWFL